MVRDSSYHVHDRWLQPNVIFSAWWSARNWRSVERVSNPRLLAATLFVVTQLACSSTPTPSLSPATCAASVYKLDVDSGARALHDSYAYLTDKAVNWPLAERLARRAADTVHSKRELVGVLERLLDNLYDAHAIVRANTMQSPRLVPSGVDLWAEWRASKAIVTAVRPGFSADVQGVRPGMEVVAINGVSIADAVDARVGPAVERPAPPAARAWGLLSALAGRHDVRRVLRVRDQFGTVRDIELDMPAQRLVDAPANGPVVEYRRIPAEGSGVAYGYIRLTALGDSRTVAAFDSALAAVRDAPGLLLDLRDAPQGGSTDVAEPILGRLIGGIEGYQRVTPVHGRAYTRTVSPRGPWTYTAPIVVLVSRWTGSMGEGMAIGLDGMHRARVVGTAMAGLAGAVDDIVLPCSGIGLAFPTARLAHIDGTPRERWVPTVLVDLAGEERGRDAILERGIRELRDRIHR